MNREICAGVGPRRKRRPSRPARQRGKGVQRVFVAVLRVNGLAGAKLDQSAGNLNPLTLVAGEVHLDAMSLGVVEGVMAEACQLEVAVELAVDAREQVEVEAGSDAGHIIVGGVEDAGILHQVDPYDQGRSG